ncbi:ATP phosphoribosyltransferase regulatory subunit [Helicobacter sp. MIT 21-1697]|uniref:ATP phosphoribosyltransferase regulatory subunit n=1 Tax=Helicobacter sp. MIT 21-1697 TaxID=2993733 RepID=UPI00224B832E|nr:ATP phosphoribosyltransferase regulatory subunit [Helicobacter sp. MIT 21-1697]MCX2716841.1 ATP phosphoribosyltransferase regulatory subunit [Helicobacter sp. MIT 21-1697]
MILEHELPQGSKLYFDMSAKLKRDIESCAIKAFYENDYREIVTPSFAFLEHQGDMFNREIVRLSSENNHQIGLRYDTTLDAMRIVTKRIMRSSTHKKWFYIQPVFSYPTTEIHQIGAEYLGGESLSPVMCLGVSILQTLNLTPYLQISNMKIPLLCAKHSDVDIEVFALQNVGKLLQMEGYMADLVHIKTKQDLQKAILNAPAFLKEELERLLECASYCEYEKTIFSPLFFAPSPYYEDLFFRMFVGNSTLLQGGKYSVDEQFSCGFAIYTDEVVECLLS